MKVLNLIGISLVALASSLSLAQSSETFERCEVDAIIAEKENKSVSMTCYSGEVKNVWKSCFERNKDMGMMMGPQHMSYGEETSYPSEDVALPGEGSSKCQSAETAKIESENDAKQRKIDALCGYCMRMPQSKKILVTNIKKDLSFFYLALKDGLVFFNVETKSGELLRAELQRNKRYSTMNDMMYDYAVPTSGSSKSMSSPMMEMSPKKMIAPGEPYPTQDCATMRLNELKSFAVDLDYQLKMREKEKSACQ